MDAKHLSQNIYLSSPILLSGGGRAERRGRRRCCVLSPWRHRLWGLHPLLVHRRRHFRLSRNNSLQSQNKWFKQFGTWSKQEKYDQWKGDFFFLRILPTQPSSVFLNLCYKIFVLCFFKPLHSWTKTSWVRDCRWGWDKQQNLQNYFLKACNFFI